MIFNHIYVNFVIVLLSQYISYLQKEFFLKNMNQYNLLKIIIIILLTWKKAVLRAINFFILFFSEKI